MTQKPMDAIGDQEINSTGLPSRRSFLSDYTYLILISGTIILFDQLTKSLVRASLEIGQMWTPIQELPFLRIVHWHNTGAAFGILRGFGQVFTILAFIVIGAMLYFFPRVPRADWPLRLAMGLQLGGAIGNLIDRLTIGWVTDFVAVGGFPVFNVADASISIGVAVLVIGVWFKDLSHPQEVEEESDPISAGAFRSQDHESGEPGEPAGHWQPEEPLSE